jgi:hypothetical protein
LQNNPKVRSNLLDHRLATRGHVETLAVLLGSSRFQQQLEHSIAVLAVHLPIDNDAIAKDRALPRQAFNGTAQRLSFKAVVSLLTRLLHGYSKFGVVLLPHIDDGPANLRRLYRGTDVRSLRKHLQEALLDRPRTHVGLFTLVHALLRLRQFVRHNSGQQKSRGTCRGSPRSIFKHARAFRQEPA